MFGKKITSLLFIFFILATGSAVSQVKLPKLPFSLPQMEKTDTVKKDSVPVSRPRKAVKTYEAIVNSNFTTQKGLFTVHQHKDTVYFEIPDSLLHRDIMVINRLRLAPAGMDMYAGEELEEKTIQFERGADSSILIRFNLLINRAEPGNEIYKAVVRSNLNPVAYSFPIKAYSKDSNSYVIDVTKFLTDKSFVNDINQKTQLAQKVNTIGMKDFRVESIHVYPINVEISISKNMNTRSGTPGDPVTISSRSSFIALPKVPLPQRLFDPRVGYFADKYNAFADKQQKAEQRLYIVRWRLEPKEKDIARWKRGEVVEPEKPIVIYIDPATPKQWRPYLILGINDWQKAFEQAGFKNAIVGKEWPENDSTMHLGDARYSMLNYFPSEVANAYGPQIHDPRSGEIIQTQIGWYHNVMSLLHSWYLIQAGATDPAARKATFDEKLMGQLIRFVSSHEVGHTLGLRHNFGSSSRTPVDSLRSKSYLKKHGHTASIMDYARFNYVAQPEDNIPQEYLFPRIGEYDRWAIEWGYKASHAKDLEEDTKIVRKWIADRLAQSPRVWFGDGELQKIDARNQTEDLGNNAMKASAYGIKNLQRILPRLPEWTYEEGGVQQNLTEAYEVLKGQYTRYIGHVMKNIGGVYQTLRSDGDTTSVYEIVPAAMQKEAVEFFNDQLFATPHWLLDPVVMSKAGVPASPNFVEDMQVRGLNSLMDINRLNTLSGNMKQFGEKALPLHEYIAAIHTSIWKEVNGSGPVVIDSYRRNLQKSYLGCLLNVLISKDPAVNETDASSILRYDLHALQKEIEKAAPRASDPMTRIHLEDLQYRITSTLELKQN